MNGRGDPPAPAEREQRAWQALADVPDPEVPALSICDLGIVRAIQAGEHDVEVTLTPTYSGCPATEVIQQDTIQALERAGLGPVRLRMQLAPAWTTDWISDEGRRKLREYGIAPPHANVAAQPVHIVVRVACPRCGSPSTERLSAFGATACKALYRCTSCREPFEYFKPL